MAHTRNAVLAARITELGLTRQQVSDMLNDAVEKATGTPGRSTDRYVRLLTEGTIRWPWLITRQALEQVLDRSILELGFIPPAGARIRPDGSHNPACDADPSSGNGRLNGQHVQDDHPINPPQWTRTQLCELLGGVAGTPISITVPAVPEQGRIGVSDVERLRVPLAELAVVDQRFGGVGMAATCLRLADQVQAAIRRCTASDRTQRALYTTAGEYLAAATWASIDACDLGQASHHLDQALRTAHTVSDPMLHAQVTNLLVIRSRAAGDHTHAHIVAGAGQAGTAARINPRVNALFHARLAYGHAHRGERGMAQRELGRARDALARATAGTPTPAWLSFFNQAELAAQAAAAHQLLGRYRQAAHHAAIAVRDVPPGHQRNKTLYTCTLAEALLGQREVEHAAAQATAALDLAATLRDGLHHGRTAHRLHHLRELLSQWPDIPEAREWITSYDQATQTTT